MSFDIINDVEKGIAAIIDPEVGRAIGPIAYGADAAKILEHFAGAVASDPTKLTQAVLETKWEKFVTDLADVQDAIEGKPVDAKVEEPTPGGPAATPSAPGTDTSAITTAEAAAVGDVGPTSVTSPTVGAAAPSNAPSGAAENGPVTTPKAGNIVCPTCDGWRTIPQGDAEVTCPTCKGTGEVLAEQPEPAPAPPAA